MVWMVVNCHHHSNFSFNFLCSLPIIDKAIICSTSSTLLITIRFLIIICIWADVERDNKRVKRGLSKYPDNKIGTELGGVLVNAIQSNLKQEEQLVQYLRVKSFIKNVSNCGLHTLVYSISPNPDQRFCDIIRRIICLHYLWA